MWKGYSESERYILCAYEFGKGLPYDRSAYHVADAKVFGVGGKLLKAMQSEYIIIIMIIVLLLFV